MKRSSKQSVQERVEAILRILLDGAQPWDLLHYASENGWSVGRRQVENYARQARKMIAAAHEKRRKKLFVMAVAQRNNLYARAVAVGDYRTALAVLHDLSLLQGLYPSPHRQLVREVKKLQQQLAEAEARRAAAGPTQPDQ
jgi:hypothetical protein